MRASIHTVSRRSSAHSSLFFLLSYDYFRATFCIAPMALCVGFKNCKSTLASMFIAQQTNVGINRCYRCSLSCFCCCCYLWTVCSNTAIALERSAGGFIQIVRKCTRETRCGCKREGERYSVTGIFKITVGKWRVRNGERRVSV